MIMMRIISDDDYQDTSKIGMERCITWPRVRLLEFRTWKIAYENGYKWWAMVGPNQKSKKLRFYET